MQNKKALYFECATGISGDMTVAALLDLGASREKLTRKLAGLPLDGYHCRYKEVKVSGLRALKFDVELDRDAPVASYLRSEKERVFATGQSDLRVSSEKTNSPDSAEDARNLKDIEKIIRAGRLSADEVSLALKIFNIIGQAEAAVHGLSLDQVHFHEVGAVDSIIDICAVAICLCDLAVTDFIFPALPVGTGFSVCHHGLMPVPVPAVAKIAELHGLKLRPTQIESELITPTGAGIVAALNKGTALPDQYHLIRTGIGAGSKLLPSPNLLRIFELAYG